MKTKIGKKEYLLLVDEKGEAIGEISKKKFIWVKKQGLDRYAERKLIYEMADKYENFDENKYFGNADFTDQL